ncbi:MAG: ATP-binding cassette domain-containing protein [Actinomycetota bacterium]
MIESSGTPVVTIDRVDAHRGSTLALRDINLTVEPGTVVSVIGPNGAGKSTLFALISQRLRPSTGMVRVEGSVGDVLQSTVVDPLLQITVEDVVRMGRYKDRGFLRPMRRVDRELIDESIERVGLADLRRRPISQLSGGQRQRALIAQGLAQDASILLLDEPAAGLDLPAQEKILEVMRTEADRGRTILFSTHDLGAAAHADVVVALRCACVCCAPPEQALEAPEVLDLFRMVA